MSFQGEVSATVPASKGPLSKADINNLVRTQVRREARRREGSRSIRDSLLE